MTDRGSRLAASRHLDWRFLLPDPRLGRIGLVEPGDAALVGALASLGGDAVRGPASELASRGGLDVVLVPSRTARSDRSVIADALRALRPGGSLVVELPRRWPWRRPSDATTGALRAAGAEAVTRAWSLPARRDARRIVPIDDREAVRAALAMHGSRPARRLQAALARRVAALGGAELLGGEVTLVAQRPGDAPASGWPSLDSIAPVLATEGLRRPSWILLTPRFAASAHVVLLLLADGHPTLVAKLARLPDDDGPEREARTLRDAHAAGVEPGTAPEVVHAGRIGGHSALVERALRGRALDRSRIRGDPARWVAAVASWIGRIPTTGLLDPDAYDARLREGIARLHAEPGGPVPRALVEATLASLAPLREAGVPLVFEHGDLGHPNLLELRNGRIGALDWELARPDGLPLNDLVFFLGYVALAMEGDAADPFESFLRVLAEPRWGASDALRAEATRRAVDTDLLPALVIACWARATMSLADRLGGAAGADPEGLRGHRYYSLWSRAVEHQGRLAAVLS